MDTLTTTYNDTDEQIIDKFQTLLSNLPQRIKNSGLKSSYISKETNIPRPTLLRKIKSGNFSVEETRILTRIIKR